MSENIQNLALSIQHQIRNLAKTRGDDTETLLYQYVAERFLYRLSISKYKDKFFLKGAFLFTIWEGTPHRATRDIDFLGNTSDQIESLENILKDISTIPYEKDGLTFDINSIKGEIIRETQSYGGIRLTQNVNLGKAKIKLQIDVGFGDAVTPSVETNDFPSLLGMDAPRIQTYPIYTVIAEKFEALVSLNINNSRMKDFYDLWFLTRKFEIDSVQLAKAIKNTFIRRKTAIPKEIPTPLTKEFFLNDQKNIQWQAFLKRNNLVKNELQLKEVINSLNYFFTPVITILS